MSYDKTLDEFEKESKLPRKVGDFIARLESNRGQSKGMEKIGATKGIFHIKKSTALPHIRDEDLRRKVDKMSDKQFAEHLSKNPKLDAKLAGRFSRNIADNLKKSGVNLENLNEDQQASAIANIYNYGKQPKFVSSLARFSNNPKGISPEEVTQNIDIGKGRSVNPSTRQGLLKRSIQQRQMFNKDASVDDLNIPKLDKNTPRIAMIPNNEDGRDLTEAEKRRRARFLAVQGGATPPKEITKVLGVDDSSEEINLITEQAPSPIAARNIANPRPVKEAQEARERVATESKERAVIQSSEKKNQGDSVIKSNPNQVKELIKSMPEMDPELQRDVEKDINLKNQGRHTERSGPASQFTEALSFFLPQIIGGLAGAAFEGTEGAIGGIEASGQARDAFLKHQETKMAREAKENKTDYKTFVDEKGRPVAKKGNSFLDLTGKQVDPSKVTQAVTFRQTRSLDQRNVEGIDRNDRFNKKFELDKQKAGQLSDTQIKDRQRVTNVLASIDRITTLKEGVDTGPFADKWGRLAEYFDKQPEGFTELKSESSDGLAKYVQALSGAQVSEQEARRLGAIIPTTADNDETFKRKLKVFKKIMEDNQAGFDEAIKSGQPLKAGQVKGLQEAEAQFLSKRNTSKKGKGVMTDKQRNRMKELQEKYPNRG